MAEAGVPPQNLEAEESVLGAMLVSQAVVPAVLAEQGLRAEHFYRDRHREIFKAICALHDQGDPLDILTVAEKLKERGKLEAVGGADVIAGLAAKVQAPGAAVHYAKIVVDNAELRHIDGAAKRIQASVAARDTVALADARAELDEGVTAKRIHLQPDDLADLAVEIADSGGQEAFPWPFERLNQLAAGGIRRGQLAVVSGHTHFGKTAFTHQCLDSMAKRGGAKCCLYINEMEAQEHLGGILQRHGQVPFQEFIQGRLSTDNQKRMLASINRGDIRWPIAPVAGWSAREVCNDIRLHRWDVAAIDILHNFLYDDERDLSNMVSLFVEAAKLAECAILLVCHVNRNRIVTGVRPRPTRGDLRGTGDIENKADIVCFVHRDQDDETFEPLEQSYIYFDKYRGGRLGGLGTEMHPLRFNERRIRFEPVERNQEREPQLGAAA